MSMIVLKPRIGCFMSSKCDSSIISASYCSASHWAELLRANPVKSGQILRLNMLDITFSITQYLDYTFLSGFVICHDLSRLRGYLFWFSGWLMSFSLLRYNLWTSEEPVFHVVLTLGRRMFTKHKKMLGMVIFYRLKTIVYHSWSHYKSNII